MVADNADSLIVELWSRDTFSTKFTLQGSVFRDQRSLKLDLRKLQTVSHFCMHVATYKTPRDLLPQREAGICDSNNRSSTGTRVLQKDKRSVLFMQNLSSFTSVQISNLEATTMGNLEATISGFSFLNRVWLECKCWSQKIYISLQKCLKVPWEANSTMTISKHLSRRKS